MCGNNTGLARERCPRRKALKRLLTGFGIHVNGKQKRAVRPFANDDSQALDTHSIPSDLDFIHRRLVRPKLHDSGADE